MNLLETTLYFKRTSWIVKYAILNPISHRTQFQFDVNSSNTKFLMADIFSRHLIVTSSLILDSDKIVAIILPLIPGICSLFTIQLII